MRDESPRQFNALASVYDTTRDALPPALADRMAEVLRERGARSVLEVGVGTGRAALPLTVRGFEVTGLDAARNMLLRAKEKGLGSALMGTAYALPFRAKSFDTALFVHILHVLGDPRRAIEEGRRVARRGAFGWVRPGAEGDGGKDGDREVWERIYRALTELGYPMQHQAHGGRTRERALLAEFPPESLTVVSDRHVTEPFSRILDFAERGGSRQLTRVPSEAVRKAVASVRAEVGDRTFSYREIDALAFWPSPR